MVNLLAYFFISLISLIALSAIVTVLISQKIKRSIPKFGKITTLKDAEIHLKKLKMQDFLKDRIIKIDKILPTNIVINIKKGDTISTIARKYSTTSKKIIELNNLTNPDKIKVGQRLFLPGEDLKYRIITTNIENIDMAQNYCNRLLNLNFRCQILSQKD